jgi:hypothetical protein
MHSVNSVCQPLSQYAFPTRSCIFGESSSSASGGRAAPSERAGSRRIRGGLGSEQEEAMAAGGLGNEQLVAWLGMAASGSVSERADVDGGRRRQARRAAGRSH